MNFEPNFASNLPDPETLELKDARKALVFDFCFRAIYPDTTEDNMRNCVLAYKRYSRLTEGVFAEVVRKRQKKPNR